MARRKKKLLSERAVEALRAISAPHRVVAQWGRRETRYIVADGPDFEDRVCAMLRNWQEKTCGMNRHCRATRWPDAPGTLALLVLRESAELITFSFEVL